MSKRLLKRFLSFLFVFLTFTNVAFCSKPLGDVSKLPIEDLEKYLQRTESLLEEIGVEGSEREKLEKLKELLNQAILKKELTDTNNAQARSSKKKKMLCALGAILGVTIVSILIYKGCKGLIKPSVEIDESKGGADCLPGCICEPDGSDGKVVREFFEEIVTPRGNRVRQKIAVFESGVMELRGFERLD